MTTTMSPEQRVSTVFQTLEKAREVDVIIGITTMLDGALEAAHVVKLHGADEETILAALLQDIGSYCPLPENWRDIFDKDENAFNNYDSGAEYLRKFGFPEKTCKLIESGILAKRYLATTDPMYLNVFDFSEESWKEPLSPEEMSKLEKDELFQQKHGEAIATANNVDDAKILDADSDLDLDLVSIAESVRSAVPWLKRHLPCVYIRRPQVATLRLPPGRWTNAIPNRLNHKAVYQRTIPALHQPLSSR
ncbi:hypothetical protein GGF41_002201 [Coemansia sp. RSA 2531]|nr:hypothetical protein GGF41_002201 [Coemansia sp. RSA 2531]